MIYTANYFYSIETTLQPPCWLPGCSWDNDTTGDKWCIYLGILGPAQNNTTTSNVPPMANNVSDTNYNYNLVTQYGYIGPISCNDNTLTCSTSSAQNVPFPQ